MGISIGLVGLGAFGSTFAELFKNHPLVDRVGLCDRESERIRNFAERESWRDKFDPKDTYVSVDEICRSDLDALVIVTQPWLHAPQCLRAMESGKHVYSAVPLICLPDGDEILDWCERLIETCKRTGMHYMLGETTYYRPEGMFCRRKAAEAAFGTIIHAEGHYLHDVQHGLGHKRTHRTGSTSGKEWLKREKEYIDKGILGGPMHYPTHSTSGPVFVMNAHAVKVTAYGFGPVKDHPWHAAEAFSNETAFFKMSNGATVRICEWREVGRQCAESFCIYGTEGCYVSNHKEEDQWHAWEDLHTETVLDLNEMCDPLPPQVEQAFRDMSRESGVYGRHGGSHPYLVHEFVDAIAHGRQPAINAWEAVRYTVMGVMAHKSALRDGETLDVPDWGEAPD